MARATPRTREAGYEPIRSAETRFRSRLTTESAVIRPVRGFSLGTLAIVIENESLMALAKNQGKTQASAKWQKMISDVQESGISRIVSNSLWIDVTPK